MDPSWCSDFPQDPLLVKLLEASRSTTDTIVHDENGLKKSYPELLGDILKTRDAIRKSIPPSSMDNLGMLRPEAPYIGFLALSGYEFLVAFFACRAIGGACMPFGSGILPQEAFTLLRRTEATALLVGKHLLDKGQEIEKYGQKNGYNVVAVEVSSDSPRLEDNSVTINDSVQMDVEGPGFVLFTSGTTGPPKGVVLPRRCFAYSYTAEPASAALCDRPPHWLGGALTLLESVLTGRRLYIISNHSEASALWDAFKNYNIDWMLLTPGILRRMKQDYEHRILTLPKEEQSRYVSGVRNLKHIWVGGGMPSMLMIQFWENLIGKPIPIAYGATEMGNIIMGHNGESTVKYSIGSPFQGVQVKLSNGESGTILVKCPSMMTHYIGDENTTKPPFDSEGFLDSGDVGHLEEGEVVFDGRALSEFIFFDGYRIPVVALEHTLETMPYLTEGYIVAVPDHESNQLCGALVRAPKDSKNNEEITLAKIRRDLSKHHPTYMLPVLLRLLKDGEEVPLTVSQKPVRKEMVKQYFLSDDYWSVEAPTPGVECWDRGIKERDHTGTAWDWADYRAEEGQCYAWHK